MNLLNIRYKSYFITIFIFLTIALITFFIIYNNIFYRKKYEEKSINYNSTSDNLEDSIITDIKITKEVQEKEKITKEIKSSRNKILLDDDDSSSDEDDEDDEEEIDT